MTAWKNAQQKRWRHFAQQTFKNENTIMNIKIIQSRIWSSTPFGLWLSVSWGGPSRSAISKTNKSKRKDATNFWLGWNGFLYLTVVTAINPVIVMISSILLTKHQIAKFNGIRLGKFGDLLNCIFILLSLCTWWWYES